MRFIGFQTESETQEARPRLKSNLLTLYAANVVSQLFVCLGHMALQFVLLIY